MAGVAVDINLMAWMYGSMVYMLVMAVQHVFAFMTYNALHTKSQDDDAATALSGEALKADWQMEWMHMVAGSTAVEFELYAEHKNWMAAQWMSLSPEQQEKMMMEKKGKGDDAKEEAEEEEEVSADDAVEAIFAYYF